MTTTLVVLAHPEGRSFNGAWAQATISAAQARGDTVLVSNLCAMGFNPVEGAERYDDWGAQVFDPLKAQETRAAQGQLPRDVAGEIAKVRAADRIVFHFPIWWFGPPAILKGWFDRVFAHGALHTVDERFDQGRCRGKEAVFCVTTGSRAHESAFNGKEGDVQMLLWPSAYTLRYLGFTVRAPEIVHGVHGYFEGAGEAALQARLRGVLADQAALLERWEARAQVAFNRDDEFEDGSLKTDAPSLTPFIRHTPHW